MKDGSVGDATSRTKSCCGTVGSSSDVIADYDLGISERIRKA